MVRTHHKRPKLIISGQPKTGTVLHYLRIVFSTKIMSSVLNYVGVKIIRGVGGIRQEMGGDKTRIWKAGIWTEGVEGNEAERHSSGRAQGRV